MSAEGELAASRRDARAAGVLERQADREGETDRCGPVAMGTTAEVCWSAPEASGAAAEDVLRASQLRDAAARHRAISRELLIAETQACAGIPEADVVASPFAHRRDIVAVQVIREAPGPGGESVVRGARIRFHHLGGLTVAWLQHLVDCHLARDSALRNAPELSFDPLAPPDVTATVTEVPHGYVIEVRSNDPTSAQAIAERALALRR